MRRQIESEGQRIADDSDVNTSAIVTRGGRARCEYFGDSDHHVIVTGGVRLRRGFVATCGTVRRAARMLRRCRPKRTVCGDAGRQQNGAYEVGGGWELRND